MNEGDAIAASLRCFTLGVLSFVPVLGVVCGVAAVFAYMNTSCDAWNPARRYAIGGVLCAALGLFSHATLISIIVVLKYLD